MTPVHAQNRKSFQPDVPVVRETILQYSLAVHLIRIARTTIPASPLCPERSHKTHDKNYISLNHTTAKSKFLTNRSKSQSSMLSIQNFVQQFSQRSDQLNQAIASFISFRHPIMALQQQKIKSTFNANNIRRQKRRLCNSYRTTTLTLYWSRKHF